MPPKEEEEEIRARYEAAGQGHVLKYLPQLSDDEKSSLLSQLANIEVEKLSGFLQAALDEQSQTTKGGKISPFSKSIARTTDESSKDLLETSRMTGLAAIKKGQVAALVLAGGQGTRLGFNGPKGMYDIGLPSGRTLFQLIVERLRRLGQLAATDEANAVADEPTVPPFYIMTSPLNHEETISYFKENSYFGMKASDVQFFCQGMLPCLTDEGKIILESPAQVAMAPDGNGGIYPSLVKSGMLDDMTSRGIEYLHVFSIDNALVKPADPVFIGYCIAQGADCGNKVLWKSHAHEKVGVLAEKDGKPCIVEYSDISTEMAERTDQDGRLVFGAGNICNHFYTLDFIRDVIVPNLGNMYHIAKKKIPYYNEETSETVTPTSNNGMKLESFIFDVFPLSKSMAVLDVSRDEEFAPVKNAPGSASDSPDTAREMISTLAKKWVKDAGGNLVGDIDSTCEIPPLLSYSGEGLTSIVKDKDIDCPFSL
jgi:UDP-N-acetylglucosamine/UDP-N-acetylgalactosamine diphosphorylase